jgi:hypothetical protein
MPRRRQILDTAVNKWRTLATECKKRKDPDLGRHAAHLQERGAVERLAELR